MRTTSDPSSNSLRRRDLSVVLGSGSAAGDESVLSSMHALSLESMSSSRPLSKSDRKSRGEKRRSFHFKSLFSFGKRSLSTSGGGSARAGSSDGAFAASSASLRSLRETDATDPAMSIENSASGSSDAAAAARIKAHAERVRKILFEFWFEQTSATIEELWKTSKPTPKEMSTLTVLSSYAPMLYLREFFRVAEASNGGARSAAAAATAPSIVLQSFRPYLRAFHSVVLFADISGFTRLSERLTAVGALGLEALSSAINAYFTLLIKIINSSGAEIVKFAGDAVIVHWSTEKQANLCHFAPVAIATAHKLRSKLNNYKIEGKQNKVQFLREMCYKKQALI